MPAWVIRVDALLLVLLLVLSFFVASFAATDSDLWMNLAVGKRLSAGEFEFGVDPFSWATQETPDRPAPYWVHHGWLTSWLFYQLYRLDDPVGAWLVLFKAILFTLAIGLLSRVGWNEANRWFVIICLTMAVLAVSARLQMQPAVLSLVMLAVTMFVLDRAGVFAVVASSADPRADAGAAPAGIPSSQVSLSKGEGRGGRWLWSLPILFALWANLDAWFILGPLLVGLCWAGTGLTHLWVLRRGPVPGKTLGMIFGLSLLACCVNPHHVRVFQLPPELAYLLVSLHLPLPDAVAAGGYTLQILQQVSPDSVWTISPLSAKYWQNSHIGMNIAGTAFCPLLLLGGLAFGLVAFCKVRPGSPALSSARILLWLLFALMALALYRMLGFFALVAAPLTAMTLGEFLRWQHSQSEGTGSQRRDRGLQLARLVSVPFLLLLLVLAWPGWLHGTMEHFSPRRVAWQVRPDESFKNAALTLQGLKDRGECGNVFNSEFDTPSYCAWFAPDVKGFMDARFALFAGQARDYLHMREALLSGAQRQEGDWRALFQERGIDQVVLGNFSEKMLLRFWFDAGQWRERYGDSRAIVFTWAGPKRSWPITTAGDDWGRRAFGQVPDKDRPPVHGTRQPQPMAIMDLYLKGIGPAPVEAAECQLLAASYQFQANRSLLPRTHACRWMLSIGVVGDSLASPGGGMTFAPVFLSQWQCGEYADVGPPALPVLLTRSARRAVNRNPHDYASQHFLKNAYENLRANQEDYWLKPQGVPFPLRERLRRLQQLVSQYSLTQLQIDNPEHHLRMYELYLQNNMRELALDHLRMAEKAVELKSSTAKAKEFNAIIKRYQDQIKISDADVQRRLARWKEISSGKSPLEQAELAYLKGAYQELVKDKMYASPLGLGTKALEILQGIDTKTLTPETNFRFTCLLFDLYLAMGRVDRVADHLADPNIRNILPPFPLAHYQLWVGGVQGDYEMMAEALREIEKVYAENGQVQYRSWAAMACGALTRLSSPGSQAAPTETALFLLSRQPNQYRYSYNDLFNAMTLRGIAALEAGETRQALEIFRDIQKQAGDTYLFTESPIARRYLELLNREW
jgi:hypothetical protein